ncbi:MAG: ATP-binding protein [Cryomorphaceae bacterium]|nr:ATP-binding protein [Cryomorphaceae bacterium]
MITRIKHDKIQKLLQVFPVVGIIGPRQVGKTTMANMLISNLDKPAEIIDLERPSDSQKLSNPELFFSQNREKLIVIDEVQRMPELFPIIRSMVDEHRVPARFILLGSTSPNLMRQSSESLAGRIYYEELTPFLYKEVKDRATVMLHWTFGGFPVPFLYDEVNAKRLWYQSFIQTYLERDLPMLGLNSNSLDLRRLAQLLAHQHGQTENSSAIARSLGVSMPTVKNALDYFERAFLIRRLPPWFTNVKKRLVKSAKIYYRDSGVLHSLLNIDNLNTLLANPISGFSFEGYCIEQIIEYLGSSYSYYFYRTQDGTEVDLLAVKANTVVYAFEVKMSGTPTISKSMKYALDDLKPQKLFVIIPLKANYPLADNIQVCGLEELLEMAF